MKQFTRFAVVLLGTFALVSCEQKKPDAAPVASSAPVSDDQIATASDFEEAASKDINEDNAEAELAKIEKQISE